MAEKSSVYSPEFIPYYPKESKEYKFNKNEAIIYGFIRFYTKNGQKFFFSNTQIANITDCGERTVTRAIEKFDSLDLFAVVYSNKANGGTIRFIQPNRNRNKDESTPPSQNGESGRRLAKMASPTSQIGESAPEVEEKTVQAKNKIKENKRKISFKKEEKPSDDTKDYLQKKAHRKVIRSLKRKHGGTIPAWEKAKLDELVDEEVTKIPISVSITREYREFCLDISEDRKAFHIATVEGQRMWNSLKEEGYHPAQIKCASRIAYKTDGYWKDNFTPELFFRKKTQSTGQAIDHIGKYLNKKAGTDPEILKIKQEMKLELGK